ncbi:MAG: class I SAM-dependent methyltransferase [Candidatus Saccharibacteria bacterium]|nr:class I SAM-dependent methyltransferase [Candidatus Saccharibacteria bacterium]
MTNWKQVTVDTYNKSAKELAEYFRGIGSRVKDIEKALELAGNTNNPKVLEIGCGDGRDAKEIVKRTKSYLGFDISEELIKLAKVHAPGGKFVVADAVRFNYGKDNYDVVFAFASLLHLNKSEVGDVLQKVHVALKENGVFYVSLKLANTYEEKVKDDKFGKRMFYFYNPQVIKELAGDAYEVVDEDGGFVTVGNTKWFEMALRKR